MEYTDPDALKKTLKYTHCATQTVLERLITKLGAGEKLASLQHDSPQHTPDAYKRGLINIYVDELFIEGKRLIEQREQREQAMMAGRPDNSTQLKSLLQEDPWECPICFESFDDPLKIYVTCNRDENAQRDSENAQRGSTVGPHSQHKACSICSERLKECPSCRQKPPDRFPLTRFWNGHMPIKMMMGGACAPPEGTGSSFANPYLVNM